jgi:polysaccharide export outer membrane protein
MKLSGYRKRVGIFTLMLPWVLLISSCTIPGMRLNVTAQGSDEPYVDFNARDATNVDVFPINMATIQRLRDERQAEPKPTAVLAAAKTPSEDYKVGPQDVLRVTVWDHPELNNPSGTTTADPASSGRIVAVDGTMFYPYVGTIKVEGKTIAQIQNYIKTSLARVIREPQVEVAVQTYKAHRVFVAGEVKTPMIEFVTDAPLRISEAIAAAGGPTPDADVTRILLTRAGKSMVVDLYGEFASGDVSQDVVLQAGDVVMVPEGRPRKVFVMGEIGKQGSLPFPPGKYSLTDALGDSGGVVQFSSNPAQIYVIRISGGKPVIFHLNARNPDALLIADDFDLYPRDVIYVEAAEISRIGRVISQIVPAAQALATGRTIAQ